MSVSSRSLTAFTNKYFREILDLDGVTEVCYNGRNKIFSLSGFNTWEEHSTKLDSKTALSVVTSISSVKNTEIDEDNPVLSSVLDKGERVQAVVFPATLQGVTSITIRKPSTFKISMDEYEEANLFDVDSEYTKQVQKKDELLELYKNKKYRKFIEEAVLQGKTLVISGATGSGKTTFMKTLIDLIPKHLRIISIEDVEELVFTKHKNYVQLFYKNEAFGSHPLSPTSMMKSCLRMKPDVMILAELRGAETFDFINIINSGHSGSITSCHAGSVEETFSRLQLMMLQSPSGQKIPHDVINKTLRSTIDVVIHMSETDRGRRITEVYYKDYELLKKDKEVAA